MSGLEHDDEIMEISLYKRNKYKEKQQRIQSYADIRCPDCRSDNILMSSTVDIICCFECGYGFDAY